MTKRRTNRIRFVGNLRRVNVRPGDLFVLTFPWVVTISMMKIVQQAWSKQMKVGRKPAPKLIIIGDGGRLGVIGREGSK
jgi:hypothetical protein